MIERPILTADIVIIAEDTKSVLLIERKHEPYKGMWALPGGKIEKGESLKNAAIRELKEETSVTGVDVEQFGAFGEPGRDPRGWFVSVGYVALIPSSDIYIKAADDAETTEWFPIDELPELAFDHKMIIGKAVEHIKDLYPLLYTLFKNEK